MRWRVEVPLSVPSSDKYGERGFRVSGDGSVAQGRRVDRHLFRSIVVDADRHICPFASGTIPMLDLDFLTGHYSATSITNPSLMSPTAARVGVPRVTHCTHNNPPSGSR